MQGVATLINRIYARSVKCARGVALHPQMSGQKQGMLSNSLLSWARGGVPSNLQDKNRQRWAIFTCSGTASRGFEPRTHWKQVKTLIAFINFIKSTPFLFVYRECRPWCFEFMLAHWSKQEFICSTTHSTGQRQEQAKEGGQSSAVLGLARDSSLQQNEKASKTLTRL